MSDINMHNSGTVEVKGTAADAPDPMDLGDVHQNPPSPPPKDLTADASGSRKRRRGPKGRALVKNEDLLSLISWSKLSQPDADLDDLIVEGRRIVNGYDKHRRDWEQDGKPACDACKKVHAPPCMTPEEAESVRLQRHLLRTYESEAKRDAASIPVPPASASGKPKGKGKEKEKEREGAAAAKPQDKPLDLDLDLDQNQSGKEETAEAPAKQDKPSKRKGNRPCDRCGKYHSTPCFLQEKCAKCDTYHHASQPCLFSKQEVQKWSDFMSSIESGPAAVAAGQMFMQRFASSGASSSGRKGKGKKRKEPEE
jgi:hypothetical protein